MTHSVLDEIEADKRRICIDRLKDQRIGDMNPAMDSARVAQVAQQSLSNAVDTLRGISYTDPQLIDHDRLKQDCLVILDMLHRMSLESKERKRAP